MSNTDSDVPYGYCQCGCGEKTNLASRSNPQRGQRKGEPYRYLLGHHRRKSPVAYIVDEQTGCWVWQRRVNELGYGLTWPHSKKTYAHRVVYEQERGPIPAGLGLDHLCRNPSCVNPDHLEPVTHRENVRRGAATKLTMEKARLIRRIKEETDISMTALAKRFGVTRNAIRCILTGSTWQE